MYRNYQERTYYMRGSHCNARASQNEARVMALAIPRQPSSLASLLISPSFILSLSLLLLLILSLIIVSLVLIPLGL